MIKPKVSVVQMGARRGYETARLLYRQGMLHSLISDAAWPEGKRKNIGLVSSFPKRYDSVKRRTVPIPSRLVESSFFTYFAGYFCRKLARLSNERSYRVEDYLLGRRALNSGALSADAILSVGGSGGIIFLRRARDAGLRVATEMFINPAYKHLMAQENSLWGSWGGERVEGIELFDRFVRDLIEVSDVLLCPSDIVVQECQKLGATEAQTRLVPYGLGGYKRTNGNPIQRRILFVGHANIRKGLPYLAQAASLLANETNSYDFRIAGEVDKASIDLEVCRELNFLGRLSKTELISEYRSADVFCLPSLAEGSASASIEALAHGLPVVATLESGTTARDNVEGLIVPSRSSQHIALAIRQICENREFRKQLSENALRRSLIHSDDEIALSLDRAIFG